MIATVTLLGIVLRNTRVQSGLLNGLAYLRKIGDLSGDNPI